MEKCPNMLGNIIMEIISHSLSPVALTFCNQERRDLRAWMPMEVAGGEQVSQVARAAICDGKPFDVDGLILMITEGI